MRAAVTPPHGNGNQIMKSLMKKIIACATGILLLAGVCLTAGCATSIAERRNDTSSTLYVGYVSSAFPTTFFPWQSRDGIAPTVSSMIYNTLFTFDEETGEYLPSMAKEWCYTDYSGNPLVDENGEIDTTRWKNTIRIPIKSIWSSK